MPGEIIGSRPHLCLACCNLLWSVVPLSKLDTWLDAAETMLLQSLAIQTKEVSPTQQALQEQQEQEEQLGEVIAFRTFLQSFKDDAPVVLARCQRAVALLSEKNVARAHVTA